MASGMAANTAPGRYQTRVVGQGGIEPPTSRLSGERSHQLSYCPSAVLGRDSNPRPPAEKTLQGGLGALPLSYPFLPFPPNSGGQSCATHPRSKPHEGRYWWSSGELNPAVMLIRRHSSYRSVEDHGRPCRNRTHASRVGAEVVTMTYDLKCRGSRTRTRNRRIWNPMRYQLRHTPKNCRTKAR